MDPVRLNTDPECQFRIDHETAARVQALARAPQAQINQRLRELDGELDIERVMQIQAAVTSLAGAALSVRSKWWLLLIGVNQAFLMQHALGGWCPPLALWRSRGVRTKREIDVERMALKAMRGDFDDVDQGAALHAARDPEPQAA